VDLFKALRALYDEREKLDRVIASLEELQRRAALHAAEQPVQPKRRGRKFMDEASRKQVSERMKAYWAARRAAMPDDASAEDAGSRAGPGPAGP
jgi:hypothetical protein